MGGFERLAPTAALFLLLCSQPASSTTAGGSAEEPGLFGAPEPLTLRIESKWRELTRHPESGRARDGRLSYTSPTGAEVELSVRLTTRGKSRLEVCSFPMLSLDLDPEQIRGTLFEGDPDVHLTTLCQDRSTYLQYLVHEYLAYRSFALLTDQALGARWVALEYLDPSRGGRVRKRHAFLVEDIGVAATRLGLEWLRPKTIRVAALDTEACGLFLLFQYMIGNTDWAVRRGPPGESCCHNVAMLGRPGGLSELVPVPFDFDSSGLVEAEYSLPDPLLGISSTRRRVYRGFCRLNPHLEGAISRFNAVREPILALVSEDNRLAPSARKRTINYLEAFYETINDPKKIAKRVLERCRPGS